MHHIYGVPALDDSDRIYRIAQWSRALARAIAARDAAIVRDTGQIPEGDPETVAGMVARLGAVEAALAAPVATWEPMPGIAATMKAAGHGSPPQIFRHGTWRYLRGRFARVDDTNFESGAGISIATLPAADRPTYTQGGMGQVTGLGYSRVEVSAGGPVTLWLSKTTSWAGVDGFYWTTN